MITYDKRNRAALDELAPNTKIAAKQWYEYCVQNNIDILITDTVRTLEEQKANVASGASHTMKSYHLVGQALDFVPVINGKADWSKYSNADIQRAIKEALRLGFTWGGTWTTLVDKPHLEFHYHGYGTDKSANTLSDEVIAEIKRKAVMGIPLSDVSDVTKVSIYTAETKKPYQYTIQAKGNVSRYDVDSLVESARRLGFKVTVTKG